MGSGHIKTSHLLSFKVQYRIVGILALCCSCISTGYIVRFVDDWWFKRSCVFGTGSILSLVYELRDIVFASGVKSCFQSALLSTDFDGPDNWSGVQRAGLSCWRQLPASIDVDCRISSVLFMPFHHCFLGVTWSKSRKMLMRALYTCPGLITIIISDNHFLKPSATNWGAMLPIPVNTMLRPVTLPSSPALSPMRRGSLPRSFTDLEVSDLEKHLQHSPTRKGSLQLGDMLHNMDLETMLPPKSPIRRSSLQVRSDYDVILNSKLSDFEFSSLAPANGLRKDAAANANCLPWNDEKWYYLVNFNSFL